MKKQRPRCCGIAMEPAEPHHVDAVATDHQGQQTRIESRVWECGACRRKEAVPERLAPLGKNSLQTGDCS